MKNHNWDIFICHASEDKKEVARPISNLLSAFGLRVWLDESELELGDSLREKIDDGLAQSRFGIVILSPNFFAKHWTKSELGGLIAREVEDGKVVLPILHNLTPAAVRQHSPILADRFLISTNEGLPSVARKIRDAIERSGSRYRPGAPIFAGRLTKKTFLNLPEGSFLMSNVVNPDLSPAIAEEIPPMDQRQAYWALRRESISLCKFYVFSNAGEYRKHVSSRDIYTAAR